VSHTPLADSLDVALDRFSRHIQDLLPSLEAQYSRALKKSGLDDVRQAALKGTSPFAAARTLLAREPLSQFWQHVETTGRQLAKLNVPPAEITAGLRICDDLIDSIDSADEYLRVREQLKFSTIMALNEAYSDVREEEHKAFYRFLEIEVESSNTDVLLRRLVECVSETIGSDAAHAYLLSANGSHWEVRASTARGPSTETLALVNAPAAVRRALAKPRRVTSPAHILDPGWRDRYQVVWSAPIRDAGLLQFAFAADRELLPREVEMLTVAGERCYAATRKTRLLEEITQREEQLSKLAIRMLMVEENERRRISRELHDDTGQSLVVIRLQMELIEQLLPQGSEERERLAEARDITEKSILAIRRLISDLSPAVLEQLGLGAALRQLVNRFRMRFPCQVDLVVEQLPPLDANFELVLYRLAQECLDNIAQHSQATTVNILVSTADGVLRLHVEDNGNGFDVEHSLERADSFGLIGIRERVAVLGGSVEFISTRKEGQSTRGKKKTGTVVRIELPIP
jgi:signal transduction histidine kinase